MPTFRATTTVSARPEAVLDILTDPRACTRWAPVAFEVDGLDTARLRAGSRARVSGRLAGRRVGFDVQVSSATADGLALTATGPIALAVAYELVPHADGAEVRASVTTSRGGGLAGRLLARATEALLAAGALDLAMGRIAREACA
jgi:uncharacterized protein YndB with AHSA1/START domain